MSSSTFMAIFISMKCLIWNWKLFLCFYLGGILKLRWPTFSTFWPPTYLWLTLLLNRAYYYSWHLVNHLPTPFGQRSFWMPPKTVYERYLSPKIWLSSILRELDCLASSFHGSKLSLYFKRNELSSLLFSQILRIGIRYWSFK